MNKPLASIVSVGVSKFGKLVGKNARDIFYEAYSECLEAVPKFSPSMIKAAFIGQMSGMFEHQEHNAPIYLEWCGLLEAEGVRVESACASSGAALKLGVMAIASGIYDVVLVGGVEKMTHLDTSSVTDVLATASDRFFEQVNGLTFPALYALMATAHMKSFGTTEEQMALVAVKNHGNANLNSKAHMYGVSVDLDKVLGSRVIAWPLKLYDCSLISDGAACLILTKPELAYKFSEDVVHIIGFGQGHDTISLFNRDCLTSLKASKIAAGRAYNMAGVKPSDVDVAEVHDCFTIAEIIAYEDLGFCCVGEGGKLIEDRETFIGGRIPVNTSGGLKAKGHPVGATGAAQACEIYLQLVGKAGGRQVKGAKIGLTHNVGGSGATTIVHIYVGGDHV
ncbi:MAG: thiolase domain-containing protein [Candidatus Methanomethylicia archaeon]